MRSAWIILIHSERFDKHQPVGKLQGVVEIVLMAALLLRLKRIGDFVSGVLSLSILVVIECLVYRKLFLFRFLHPSSKHGRYTSTTKWRTLEPDYREQFVFNNTSPTDLTKQTLNITVWHQEKGKPDIYMGKSEHLNNTSPL